MGLGAKRRFFLGLSLGGPIFWVPRGESRWLGWVGGPPWWVPNRSLAIRSQPLNHRTSRRRILATSLGGGKQHMHTVCTAWMCTCWALYYGWVSLGTACVKLQSCSDVGVRRG